MSEEEPRKILIFGNREIFPIGISIKKNVAYDEKQYGTFEMANGVSSYPMQYVENPSAWIPVDLGNLDSKVIRNPTFQDVLIMWGKLNFGAIWNDKENQFEITEESKKWLKETAWDKVKYLAEFTYMEYPHNLLVQGKVKERIKTSPDGKLKKFGVAGFSKPKASGYQKIVNAFNDPKKGVKILGKGKVISKDSIRGKKEHFVSETAEADQKWRQNFYDQQYIKDWIKNIDLKGTETHASILSAIAPIFLITNYLKPERFKQLTEGLKNESDNVKEKTLKRIVAIWKHWNAHFETDKEFYEAEWTDTLYDPTEKLSFPPNTWEALVDFPERDKKHGIKRKYDEESREDNARRQGARFLVSFVSNAPDGDSWGLKEKQQAGSMLSRKIREPEYADIGQDIDDKHVREAIKFLETGKIHQWSQKIHNGKKTYEKLQLEEDGEMKTIYEPVMDLVLTDDPNPHYNKTLKEYQKFGSPYSPTSPASLLFRLSVLTGWRKTEGLTCPTRIMTKAKALKLKDFKRLEKPSGINISKKGVLELCFLTRKTKKTGKTYFRALIPPFSSSILDTRETISNVMLKAGLGKWRNTEFYSYEDEKSETDGKTYHVEKLNPKWDAEIIDFDEKEKAKLYPARTFKVAGFPQYMISEGTPSQWLIGEDGQFYPMEHHDKTKDKDIPYYDIATGTEIAKKENASMIRAYLDFPLRECYAIMGEGTTVKKYSGKQVEDQAELDLKELEGYGETMKVFSTDNGWATMCSSGCPKKERGSKQEGKYSDERMDQDVTQYTHKEQPYWIKKLIHSLRHLFAQIWLRKSKWNFGVVADRGHWETLDTLKKHYGGIPDETLTGFMEEVMGSDQVGENRMKQAINRDIQNRLRESGDSEEMASEIVEERKDDVTPTGEETPSEEADLTEDLENV